MHLPSSLKTISSILIGTISAWVLFSFLPVARGAATVPNLPPILSFSPAEGFDGVDTIDPDTAPVNTPITFSVIYTDLENHPPVITGPVIVENRLIPTARAAHVIGPNAIELFITTTPGSPPFFSQLFLARNTTPDPAYPELHDGNYTNGEQYSVTVAGGFPHEAEYEYFFRATDGDNFVYFPGMPWQTPPFTFTLTPELPSNQAPTLAYSQESGFVTDGIDPNKGTADLTLLTFRTIYTDEDNNPPSYVAVSIDNGGGPVLNFLQPDIGDTVSTSLKDGDFTNDEQYIYSDTFPKGQYQYHFETSDGEETVRLPENGELSFVIDYQPVIIIPGITGSWNWDVLIRDNVGGEWEFPPFTNVYQPLADALTAQGYVEGKTLFTAFYDWRQPNVLAAQQYLKPVIDKAKQASGSDRVDIIAHSMGGILARAYIQGGHYENDVDQFFMLGTPNQGSSDLYTVWEGGHIPNNWSNVQKYLFKAYFFYRTLKLDERSHYYELHSLFLSLRDLLPTYDYLNDKSTNIVKLTSTLHEQNLTLNSFNTSVDDLNMLVGNVTTIAGDNQATVANISFVERTPEEDPLWIDGKPDPINPERNSDEGDNRVLLSSVHIQTILDQVTLPDTKHGDLPSKAASEVFSRLGLSSPGTLALVDEPDSILSFMIASPVAPTVTDPQGNTISLTINTIPEAIYFGEDDPGGMKMILIPGPLNGEYHIDLTPVGSGGHYDFASALYKENFPDSLQAFSGEVVPGTEISYLADLNLQNLEEPLFTEVVDIDPPVLEILSPGLYAQHIDTELLPLQLTGSDALSGIAELNWFLDNMLISSTTTTSTLTHILDLSLTPLGAHNVKGEGKDGAGNTAIIEASFESITSFDAVLTNLDHYVSLGLMRPLARLMLTPRINAAKRIAALYTRFHHRGIKKSLNALLDSLAKEVVRSKKRDLIRPPALQHLRDAFYLLKV